VAGLVQRLLIDLEDCIPALRVIVALKEKHWGMNTPRLGFKGAASRVEPMGRPTNVEVSTWSSSGGAGEMRRTSVRCIRRSSACLCRPQ
jgi:hypothetical protein